MAEVKVIYVPSWCPIPPPGYAGITLGRFVIIDEQYKERVNLLEHEKKHAEQYIREGFFGYLWKYVTSKHFRFECEAEAYAESVRYSDTSLKGIEYYANILRTKYRTNYTQMECINAIQKYL